MSSTTSATGSCLCGAVTVKASAVAETFAACHCGMCRKWGGGPFLAVGAGAEVEIDGAEAVGIFDSSKWAERGFCKHCGTHLFYRIKGTGEHQLPVGLFGDSVDLRFSLQVFIDRKPDGYSFCEQTKLLTEAQIWEKYGPSS